MNMDIIAKKGDETDTMTSIALIKNDKPTPALAAMVTAELAIDAAIGFGLFRLFKFLSK